MKISKLTKSLLFLLCLVMPLSSCKGGDTSSSTSTNSSSSSVVEDGTITIAEAIDIATSLNGALSEEEYLIKGTIENILIIGNIL